MVNFKYDLSRLAVLHLFYHLVQVVPLKTPPSATRSVYWIVSLCHGN